MNITIPMWIIYVVFSIPVVVIGLLGLWFYGLSRGWGPGPESKCKCSYESGVGIPVDNIKNPLCPRCGKKIEL